MTIYLFQFNNMYNRIVKRYDKLSDYEINGQLLHALNASNFNPNDGVTTKHDFNYDGSLGSPDYCLVMDGSEIVSRWYVTEAVRTQGQQFRVSLMRDLIADWYQDIIEAPCFIEKAFLDKTDTGIYNSESMSFNQIRKNIDLLYDKSKCPWLVGYIPRNTFQNQEKIDLAYVDSAPVIADYTVDNLSEWPYVSQLNTSYISNATSRKITVVFDDPLKHETVCQYDVSTTAIARATISTGSFSQVFYNGPGFVVGDSSQYASKQNGTITGNKFSIDDYYLIDEQMKALFGTGSTSEPSIQVNSLIGVQSKSISGQNKKTIFETSTGLIYTVQRTDTTEDIDLKIEQSNGGALYQWLSSHGVILGEVTNKYGNRVNWQANSFNISARITNTIFTLETSLAQPCQLTINPLEIDQCEDSPYDIFCMPYSDDLTIITQDRELPSIKGLTLAVGQSLATKLGNNAVYDLQLLPYCPIQGKLSNQQFDSTGLKTSSITDSNDNQIGLLIWVPKSVFSFDIDLPLESPQDSLEFKVSHECDTYRLCSPNMSSIFEFKPTMFSDGYVSGFEVDCVYKPFNPYIHINPKFSGMYGNQTEYETRGLTLGGDFSLARCSSAWEDYELNNKYYQQIFDRQIQSIELQNKVQGIQDVANIVTGALGAGSTGAMLGLMGGKTEAGAFGAAAGLISAGAGVADVYVNKRLREDALDLTKDQFGYNLKTIQALPDTLVRTAAQDPNNPLVPTLEYYTCTDIEKQALRDKITFNGMTTMRIGTISQFIRDQVTYIKGRVIRFPESLADDYHVAAAIADEINQGVFI